jgi:toxin ParE1/3/4
MGKVVYLPEAKEDLAEIWCYLADQSGSLEIADQFIASFDCEARRFADFPETGVLRSDLAPTLRCFRIEQYLALYIPHVDGIEVVQIIHGFRDIPNLFRRQI